MAYFEISLVGVGESCIYVGLSGVYNMLSSTVTKFDKVLWRVVKFFCQEILQSPTGTCIKH